MPRNYQGRSRVSQKHRFHRWQHGLDSILQPRGDAQQTQSIDVGSRLRELRAIRGFSMRSLAEISGLNFNTLSLIENEKSSPSVSTLQQLAQALQVPITAFFETTFTQQDVVYQKMGNRPRTTFSHGLLEDLGTGLTLGEGIPLLLTLEPGADSGQADIVHTGQEFVFCLEGQLSYQVSGDEYVLEQGDSLLFQAHLPHRWGNRAAVCSRSILILCPADEDDRSTEQHFKIKSA